MEPMAGIDGVFSERGRIYTLSADPGRRVYGERLVESSGREYREWSPFRSKLSAYISNGGRSVPIVSGSTVMYLGASSGTTPSHVSDIVGNGKVVCVEFQPRMFRQLVTNCGPRPNMMPVLADATRPGGYGFVTDRADVVYEDVAQKGQADILADNMDAFGAEWGMVAVKARSEDVSAQPAAVFDRTADRLAERGFRIADRRSLEPFEKDHAMIVVRR